MIRRPRLTKETAASLGQCAEMLSAILDDKRCEDETEASIELSRSIEYMRGMSRWYRLTHG